jgi:hypothetical protein
MLPAPLPISVQSIPIPIVRVEATPLASDAPRFFLASFPSSGQPANPSMPEASFLRSPAASVSDSFDLSTDAANAASAFDQVNSVSQLTDVQPSDWAFQVLQSLVERYGCIAGYPNQTFRGDRPLSRYEFAASLNLCIDRINELIGTATADLAPKADLLALQKLQETFAPELTVLRGQIDTLQNRTATLEAHQFSTTTVLRGQVVFALSTAAGGNPPGLGETNTVLTHLTQLQLASSFTGDRDLLRINLATSNFAGEGFADQRSLNTNMALLSYQGDSSSRLEVNALDYRFAVGKRVVLAVQPVGFTLSSVLSANSPYTDAGRGAVSRFAALNPILRIGSLDSGVGLDWLVSKKWRFQLAYGAQLANRSDVGFFNSGRQAIGAQFLYRPNARVIWGFTYINAFSEDGTLATFTGSSNADTSGSFGQAATIHALGTSLQWRLAPKVTLGAWGGVILTDSTFGKVFRVIGDRDIQIEDLGAVTLSSTFLLSLGINDPFGRLGDQVVFMIGQPPKLNLGALVERVDIGNSLHFEAFYRFRINDNIAITPGFFYVTDPGNITENNGIFVGSIRTTFSF